MRSDANTANGERTGPGGSVLGALAAVLLIVVYSAARSSRWKFFVNDCLGPSGSHAVLFAAVAIFAGLLYRGSRSAGAGLIRVVLVGVAVFVSFYLRLHRLEMLVVLYAAYAFLFSGRTFAGGRLHRTLSKVADRLVVAALDAESRTPALLALVFVLLIPAGLFLRNEALVEKFALCVYYLLIVAVGLQILETKRASPKESPVMALLASGLEAVRALPDRRAWSARLTPLRPQFGAFFRKAAVFAVAFAVFMGGVLGLKGWHWARAMKLLAANPAKMAEVRFLEAGPGGYVFPAYATELQVPVRIRHPASRPLWWQSSGKEAMRVYVRWEDPGPGGKARVLTDSRPLPGPLFIGDEAEMSLRFKRPPLQVPGDYDLVVAVEDDAEAMMEHRSANEAKTRVHFEPPSGEEALKHQMEIAKSLGVEREERWSQELAATKDYRSTITLPQEEAPNSARAVTVRNRGRVPWPVLGDEPVRLGANWVRTGGKGEAVSLLDEKFDLPRALMPGESATVTIYLDLFKEARADEVRIGMVHGKEWFSQHGDGVQVIPMPDKQKYFARRTGAMRAENAALAQTLARARPATYFQQLSRIHSADYRSKIRLVSDAAGGRLTADSGGLSVELEVMNMGMFAWRSVTNDRPVNLGILWFKESANKLDYSNRVLEERCAFPGVVQENTLVHVFCRIGKRLKPGSYEVWIGPVEEGVTWFYERGDELLKLKVVVK